MKRYIPICLLTLFLTACGSATYQAGKKKVIEEGAVTADEILDNAIYGVCMASTIGAIHRRFGNSPETAQMYSHFCDVEAGLVGG